MSHDDVTVTVHIDDTEIVIEPPPEITVTPQPEPGIIVLASGTMGPPGSAGPAGPAGSPGPASTEPGPQGPQGPSGAPGVVEVYSQAADPGSKPVGALWIETDVTIGQGPNWTKLTQAQFDALAPPDPNTLYIIVG